MMDILKIIFIFLLSINFIFGTLLTIEFYIKGYEQEGFQFSDIPGYLLVWIFLQIPIFNIYITIEEKIHYEFKVITINNLYNFIYFLPVIALMGLWLI